MKKSLRIILFLILSSLAQVEVIFAQENQNSLQLSISLDHDKVSSNGKKFDAIGFVVSVKNLTDENIFLPYQLINFEKQRKDSLLIKKHNENNHDSLVKVETGIKNNQIVGSNLYNPLLIKYLAKYKDYKAEADGILIKNEKEGNKIYKSFNPFFLKAGETKVLYFIPDNMLFTQKGNFKADIRIYPSKDLTGIPESILGYRRFDLKLPLMTDISYSIIQGKGKSLTLSIPGKSRTKIEFVQSSLINETL